MIKTVAKAGDNVSGFELILPKENNAGESARQLNPEDFEYIDKYYKWIRYEDEKTKDC